jgi:hypothetical protein
MRIIVAVLASVLWLKGNTHTHTSLSDGDSEPAAVADWYRDHGYDFLVITDHDRITKLDGVPGIVLIEGEEVTDWLPKKPLHVNAIGLREVVAPQRGETPVAALQRNVDAVRKAGGIAAINHPNFGWAFGAEELKALQGATLLEIASGHPFVNMQGPPSVEAMWDEVLTSGKTMWGIGVDDSHHLKRPWDVDMAPPGKAWIVVRSAARERDAILAAIRAGEFYASTGVELEAYSATKEAVELKVKEKNGAHYRVQFIGGGGRMLQDTTGPAGKYVVRGDEQYVRAKVIDSNGRMAWCQPMRVPAAPAR